MAAKQGEYLKKSLKSRDIFFYRDEKEGFDVPSRVVYKKKALVVHFPFGRDGSQKYKYIRSVEFRDIDPSLVPGVYIHSISFHRSLPNSGALVGHTSN